MKHTPFFDRFIVFLVETGVLLAPIASLADVQYWNPTTVSKAAGSNAWDTATEAWAPTTSGTTTPGPWISGSTASFNLNSGANHISVNGPEVGALFINEGSYRFYRGSAPLSLAGPFTNRWASVQMDTDINITANQEWNIGRDTTIYGAIQGPWWIDRMGAGTLILSNANNQVAGIALQSGITRFYGGGTVLGGPETDLILGAPDQSSVVRAEIYPMQDRLETETNLRSVTTDGWGELWYKTFDDNAKHRSHIGELSRSRNGVLSIRQDYLNFPIRQTVTVGNAENLLSHGMLPPWMISTYDGNFFTYDGMLKEASYVTTDPETWTEEDIVRVSSAKTVEANTSVHAIRVSAPLTIAEGATLTTESGGVILSNQSILGNGTLSTPLPELFLYTTGTAAIEPSLDAQSVVFWGGGTLTTHGITWPGTITLHQGILKTSIAEDSVLSGRQFRGSGELRKAGEGNLTLVDSAADIGTLSMEDAGSLTLINSDFALRGGITIKAPLTLQGSTMVLKGAIHTGDKTSGVTIEIIGSGVPGEKTYMNCNDSYVRVGTNGGSHNTLIVDGRGVTEGASIEGITEPGSNGLGIGIGNGSACNTLRIVGGGCIVDTMPHSNRNNGVGLGVGSDSNRVEIIGGPGVVSRLYKAFARTLGEQGAMYNTMLIDGRGVPGSAVFESVSGRDIAVGSQGSDWNHLVITNGGRFLNGMVNVGPNSCNNRADIIGAGSAIIGNGGDSTFSFGSGNSSNNVLYVAQGGSISKLSKWATGIGNAGNPDGGISYRNRFILADGGTFTSGNGVNIGRKRGATAAAIENSITITGEGSSWNFGNATVELGVSDQGSLAQGNAFLLENHGTASGKGIRVGSMADTTEGGISTDNLLSIRDGASLILSDKATCGFTRDGVAMSSNNRIIVTTGAILETRNLEIGSPENNLIEFTDGGVLQLPTRTPSIVSLAPGDILLENAVLSYRNLSNVRVQDIASTQISNLTWRGSNALRLTHSSMDTGTSEDYEFDASYGSDHYARLEMVQDETVYRGRSGDTLTIGTHGEMLCSNTTARVDLPFSMKGTLRLVQSTLMLTQPAEIQGTVSIDLDSLLEGTPAITANDDLTIAPGATLSFTGKPVDGMVILAYEDDLVGDLHVSGLPSNYSLSYNPKAPGVVTLLHTPTILYFR